MAPLPPSVLDLTLSSLELDSRSTTPLDLPNYLSSLPIKEREALTSPAFINSVFKRDDLSILSPIQVSSVLTARDAPSPTQNTSGAISPNAINMKGLQALFALIGAGFAVGAIWFFFWAKNGGFQWRKGDWEDYKSTVLRRKGPNGTTLSNATKSTRLGGGSVVGQGYSDDGTTTITGTMTELSSEAPIIKEKSKSKKANKTNKKANAREQKIHEVAQADWEGGHDDDVRAYRHEKVAKVGGLNRDSDALHYGTDYSETAPSVTAAPPPPPQHRSSRTGESRHSSSRHTSPDKRQGRGRDFSYGQDAGFTTTPASRPARYHSPTKNNKPSVVPGAFAEPPDFDVQSQHTKAYHHPIPALNGQKNAGGGGYRRDRRDSLDD